MRQKIKTITSKAILALANYFSRSKSKEKDSLANLNKDNIFISYSQADFWKKKSHSMSKTYRKILRSYVWSLSMSLKLVFLTILNNKFCMISHNCWALSNKLHKNNLQQFREHVLVLAIHENRGNNKAFSQKMLNKKRKKTKTIAIFYKSRKILKIQQVRVRVFKLLTSKKRSNSLYLKLSLRLKLHKDD
jgi:hypothetical protein